MVCKNRGVYGFWCTSWVLITMAPRLTPLSLLSRKQTTLFVAGKTLHHCCLRRRVNTTRHSHRCRENQHGNSSSAMCILRVTGTRQQFAVYSAYLFET